MMSMKRKLVVTVTLLLFASLTLAGETRLEPTQSPDASPCIPQAISTLSFLLIRKQVMPGKFNGALRQIDL
jgi:hypothetical protein